MFSHFCSVEQSQFRVEPGVVDNVMGSIDQAIAHHTETRNFERNVGAAISMLALEFQRGSKLVVAKKQRLQTRRSMKHPSANRPVSRNQLVNALDHVWAKSTHDTFWVKMFFHQRIVISLPPELEPTTQECSEHLFVFAVFWIGFRVLF
nr:hypothetical protein [Rhodopirellula sp. JC737]